MHSTASLFGAATNLGASHKQGIPLCDIVQAVCCWLERNDALIKHPVIKTQISLLHQGDGPLTCHTHAMTHAEQQTQTAYIQKQGHSQQGHDTVNANVRFDNSL